MNISICCKSTVRTNKINPQRGETIWFICNNCNEACNTDYIEEKDELIKKKEEIVKFLKDNPDHPNFEHIEHERKKLISEINEFFL